MQLKALLGFAFGPVASAVLGLVTVPAIAWLFNTEDVGRMSVFQVALTFGLLFSMLGLDQAYVREFHEAEDKEELLLVCFFPGFILLSLFGFISFFFSSNLAVLLYKIPDPLLYWITLLAIFLMYLTRFLSLILRMEERGWAYSFSQVGSKIVQLLLIGALALSTNKKGFLELQLVVMISILSTLIFYAWSTRSNWLIAIKRRVNKALFKKLIHFGAPLIFADIAFWGLSATSMLSLRAWSTLDNLAIYFVANSFAAVAILFQSVFTLVWAPMVYKWVANDVDMGIVDRVLIQVLALSCLIVAICGSFAWILDWILPEKYYEVKHIFLCMLMQPLLYTLSEVTCIGIGIRRKTSYTIWIALLAMMTNIILSRFLVPTLGAGGAAIANGVAFTVFFFARTEISARIWRNFPRAKTYFFVSLSLVLVIVSNLLGGWFFYYICALWFLIFIFLILYFYSELKQFYSILLVR